MDYLQSVFVGGLSDAKIMTHLSNQLYVSLSFNFLQAAAILLTVRLADAQLPPESLALVLLFRRQGNLMANMCQLGASQSIQKYRVSGEDQLTSALMWSSLIKIALISGFSFSLICLIPGLNVVGFLIGSLELENVFSFAMYVVGLVFCYLAFSSWLTEFGFAKGHFLDFLISSGLFLLGILAFRNQSDTYLLLWMGVSTALVSMGFLMWFAYQKEKWRYLFSRRVKIAKEVIHYAWTRNIATFVEMALFVIVPWQFREKPEIAGPLLIVYMLMRFSTYLTIIGRVLGLRVISSRYKENKTQDEKAMLVILVIVLVLGFLAIPLYHWWGDVLVGILLPNSSAAVLDILDGLIVFMPAIGGYYVLRNFLDLKIFVPVNLFALIVAILAGAVYIFLQKNNDLDAAITSNMWMFGVFYLYIVFSFFYFGRKNLKRFIKI